MYSRESPLTGRGTASAEAVQAFFVAKGPGYKGYAPNGQYEAPPPGLGRAIVAECQRYPEHVLNSDIVAGQVLHETAAWQSRYARERNNPGGINAINSDPDQALWFDTPETGVRAHVAHLLHYIVGKGAWSQNDPRGLPDAYYGIAPDLKSLEQRWAWSPQKQYDATPPERRYGGMIATIANSLRDFANNGTWEPPMARVPKPAMKVRHSPHFDGYDDGPRQYRAFCDHIATGTKESNLNWLTSSHEDAPSCNYYIDKRGEITEIVPYQHAPWTNGWKDDGRASKPDLSNPVVKYCYDNRISPNVVCVTIEHEGEARDTLTSAQIDANCRLKAWVSQETGISLDRAHMLGHYQIDSVNRPYCPSFTEAEWNALINGAKAIRGGSTPPPPPLITPDPNARKFEHPDYGTHWVVNITTDTGRVAMYDGWKAGGELAGWGYPIGPMTLHADSVYRQAFENICAECYPRGFDGKSSPVIRKGGLPQNWTWYSAFIEPIIEKWSTT
ncbi:MAG: N-acetylmuramoyl-L-alanine amidase [Chloroflexota bacterium]|nr:N-acetylmuramoyl-L-alanine amidase [Chloroflexota bacterium]